MQETFPEVALIVIGSSSIILILIALIIASLFIQQKRKFRHRHQLENLRHQFDEEILRTQLEIQAQTYETVSRELHDNVSNTLSVALLNLNLAPNERTAEWNNRVEEAKKLLLEAKHAVKDFSWSINPQNLNEQSFDTSLEQLAQKFSRLNLYTVRYTATGKKFGIEGSRQIIIYRIVQEALSNVAKHANADAVDVTVNFDAPFLRIAVCDNGVGFRMDSLSSGGAVQKAGLKNMQARARMIGATLAVETTPGKGTAVKLAYKEEATNAPHAGLPAPGAAHEKPVFT